MEETCNRSFDARFVVQCQQLAETLQLGQTLASVVTLGIVCESDCGLRSLWHLVPLLLQGLTTVHIKLGSHISAHIVKSFFEFLADQLEGQSRFTRLINFHVDLEIDHLNAGDRLNLALAIIHACTTARLLRCLVVPIDLLSVAWDVFFDSITCLSELSELSLSPGKLELIPPVAGTPRARNKLEKLTLLSIDAPLELCADVVEALSCSLAKLRLVCNEVCAGTSMSDTFVRIRSHCLQSQAQVQSLSPLPGIFSPSQSTISSMFHVRGLPMPVMVSSLTHVDIRITGGRSDMVDLRAFFALCAMQKFSLVCPFVLLYDRDMIADMLACWPRVESVTLNPRPSNGLGLGLLPPIRVLEDVARCGPSLYEFRACLDGFSLGEWPGSNLVQWEQLRKLDLGFSIGPVIQVHTERTLDYVLRLFPALDELTVTRQDGEQWPMALAREFQRRRLSG